MTAANIRALIIDEESSVRGIIREMLKEDPDAEVAGECGNGREAVRLIKSLAPDLLFLDARVNGMSGFEVLEALKMERLPAVIFVTAGAQYAVRAFELHALDYLLKPINRERLNVAWQRAKTQIQLEKSDGRDQRILALLKELKTGPNYLERLVIKIARRILFLETDQIYWIKAEGNYVRLHDKQRSYLLRETISSIEGRLDPGKFVRIHRSAIVRIDRIQELRPWFHGKYRVILNNGTQLMLSRNYRGNLGGIL